MILMRLSCGASARYRLPCRRAVLESRNSFWLGTVGEVSDIQSAARRPFKIFTWKFATVLGLGLLVVLAASNLAYAGLSSQRALLAGPPGDLLYAAAFSEFADEWELYEGKQSARFVEEELELTVSAAQTATWSTARHYFGAFDARISAVAQDGPIDNAFGLVVHLRDAAAVRCDLPAIILCGIEEAVPLAGAALRQVLDSAPETTYLAFMISSDGYYSVWKGAGGLMRPVSAWIPSPAIRQGLNAANRIRVLAGDASYRFFINNEAVALCLPDDPTAASTYAGGQCLEGEMRESFRDDSLAPGKLGAIAQATATGGGGVVVRFDNLIVFSPAAPAEKDVKL